MSRAEAFLAYNNNLERLICGTHCGRRLIYPTAQSLRFNGSFGWSFHMYLRRRFIIERCKESVGSTERPSQTSAWRQSHMRQSNRASRCSYPDLGLTCNSFGRISSTYSFVFGRFGTRFLLTADWFELNSFICCTLPSGICLLSVLRPSALENQRTQLFAESFQTQRAGRIFGSGVSGLVYKPPGLTPRHGMEVVLGLMGRAVTHCTKFVRTTVVPR